MKYVWTFLCLCLLVGVSLYLYHAALTQSTYEGLPTVPCLDYTKPVVQNFTVTVSIEINEKKYPLDSTIGHDAGNCLHNIFTNDTSGIVYVKANDAEKFTLGQFFDVWHKVFTPQQIFSFPVNVQHSMDVIVDGKRVEDYRNVILIPQQTIQIIYR